MEYLIHNELMLCRFRKLMNEVRAGAIRRNSFEPWEVELLVDLMMCRVSRRRHTTAPARVRGG